MFCSRSVEGEMAPYRREGGLSKLCQASTAASAGMPHLKATAAFHRMACRRCACACSTASCQASQQACTRSKLCWCRRTPTCGWQGKHTQLRIN